MTRITQIEDKGAAVAWSPVAGHADVMALGAKDSGGIGFEDYGGELELYDLNMTSNGKGKGRSSGSSEAATPKPEVLGSIKTTSRFASIGWTAGKGSVKDKFQMGLLAGGMVDGTVHIWNPKAIVNKDGDSDALVASIARHSGGAVTALEFNPHPDSANLLATGGSDGEVFITSLDNPLDPIVSVPAPQNKSNGAEVTQVSWNSQVAHIVASAAGDGSATVWDLKSQKPWCEIRAETSGLPISDMAWNPTQGLHIVTASSDDRNPFIKLWDLRASTTMPLATLSGHSKGILGLAWCPHDDSLLMSCGKDNRTILWDLFTLQPIADIPNDEILQANEPTPAAEGNGSASNFYGGGLGTSQQRRYDVQWSPITRGVVSTCSFDRKVQTHSVIGLTTKCGRPPKWLKPSSAVSCGFGGAVVSVGSSSANTNNKIAKIVHAAEHPKLVQASQTFETAIAANDVIGFCKSLVHKAKQTGNGHEAQLWSFMQIIFEANAREQLLVHLGFHADTIKQAAMEYSEDGVVSGSGSGSSGADSALAAMSLDAKSQTPQMSKLAGEAVKDALLVGNFEAAVECCFRTGNLADALVLASCGGGDLWSMTQARYFDLEATKRPFLSIVSAVTHGKLGDLVASSDPACWKETLAILSTYGKSDEFPAQCIALGDRLASVGDLANSSLCHMCALNLNGAVQHWRSQLDAANHKYQNESANRSGGSKDLLALHEFVVKVTIFLNAMGPSATLEPEVAELLSEYAKALSEQGLFATAAKYCKGSSEDTKILRDRLYRSCDHYACAGVLGSVPEFPFTSVSVKTAPAGPATNVRLLQQQREQQQREQQKQEQQQREQQQREQQQYEQQQQQQQQQHNQSQPTAAVIPDTQQQGYNNVTTQQQPVETQVNSTPQLDSAWMALQDPSSGRTYYANQTTGETSWEMPQAAPAPVAAPAEHTSYATNTTVQVAPAQQQTPSKGPSTLASKYGDGFVSSASHPELAQQYGNVGTSNPYTGAARPGTAAAVLNGVQQAPASGPVDLNQPPVQSTENQPISDALLEVLSVLSSSQLTPSDKRQLSESEKSVGVLLKKLARNGVESHVLDQVMNMVHSIRNRDYGTASSIHSGLVNNEWKEHKDWLRGIKFLIQLASKKIY